MKIAVTGASGFIGRYVIRELNKQAVEVVAVTRDPGIDVPELKNGWWRAMNISRPPRNAFDAMGRPDVLIHLAWSGLPNYKSLHHYESELPAQYTFLRSLVDQGLKSMVVAGTCAEYGLQTGELFEWMPTKPDNPYGFAKDTLRKQLEFLQREIPFNLTWTRLFYLYGEGQSHTSLYPQLKKAVEDGLQVFNMSGGEQLRDYLPVSELAYKLSVLAMGQQNPGIINVCSGHPISVRSLVEKWISEHNWDIKPNLGYYKYSDYEPMAFWGNSKKMMTLLGSL